MFDVHLHHVGSGSSDEIVQFSRICCSLHDPYFMPLMSLRITGSIFGLLFQYCAGWAAFPQINNDISSEITYRSAFQVASQA